MAPNRTILISINTSWNIYHFRAPLIAALKAQGYSIVSAAPDDAYTPRLRALVDEHISLPMDNAGTSPLRDIALFLRYLRVLHSVRPCAMLTYTIKPNIYGAFAARLLGIPVIANVSGLGTAFLRGGWLSRIAKLLYRVALRGAHRVFFQNSEDRALFIKMKLVAPKKTVLLPGSGIDLQHFSPRDTVSDPASFMLIARLLWDKGIGEFIEAARTVKALHPEAKFRLVGPKGVQNQTVIADAVIDNWVAEGVIEYLGAMDDVRDVMAQHGCIVLPSYREGMSRVLLEAAAMGKPMVVTDVAGCRQAVDEGVNGFLCGVQDAPSLAAAMLRYLESSAADKVRMGRESRAKAEREFDQQRVFDAYQVALSAI